MGNLGQKAVGLGDFASRCLSIDLEVGKRDSRIHRFAAVRGDTGEAFTFEKGDLAAALGRLDMGVFHALGVRKPSHVFLFAEGLLRCDRVIDEHRSAERCSGEMRCVSGTGKDGRVHPYYQCRDCLTRLPARAVEDLVKWRLQHLLGDERKLDTLVALTNTRLREELPKLAEQRELLAAELKRITAEAHTAAATKDAMTGEAQKFLQERLDAIIRRRGRVVESLEALDRMAKEVDTNMIQKNAIRDLVRDFGRVFDEMAPYKKKDLVKKMIGQVRLSELRMAVGLDSDPCAGLRGPELGPEESEPASRTVLEAGSFSVKTGGDGRGIKPPAPI